MTALRHGDVAAKQDDDAMEPNMMTTDRPPHFKQTTAGRSKTKPKSKKPAERGKAPKAPAAAGLLPRTKVKPADCWDLAVMFPADAAWEAAMAAWEPQIARFESFKGKLGESAETLAACLRFDSEFDRTGERLGVYAYLKAAENQANSTYQRLRGRHQHVSTKAAEASAFIRPEILAIPDERMSAFLADAVLADWRFAVEQILRYRPHTLTPREEQLLAMQGNMASAAGAVFRQLNDTDLMWGTIKDEKGRKVELGHSAYSRLLHNDSPRVRRDAFHAYYRAYDAHKNSLAAAYAGSVHKDVYYAKARGYPSALDHALFGDRVPRGVYENLIGSVHKNLPTLHRYYDLRKRALALGQIHQYDTYVPIIPGLKKKTPWDNAVKTVVEALQPLGNEYVAELERGLTVGRWCDRYPNQGKQSGAFSYGTYDGQPYILMNYQPDVLDHVFTLAHEAGHSMHSFLSKRQPFQYYHYTIFVAEVASTFNEQLLLKHLLARTRNRKERAYLISHAVDEIRGTIVRQTMFAEFEKITHELVEAGEVLTVDKLRSEYRKLLDLYFGPTFAIDPELELECLRIPHFYRAFYVYKYATGLSAAIALSERVTNGGQQELGDYLTFLRGGSSKYPLDLLKGAGVDMEQPGPVDAAMQQFAELVDELDGLL